ncbi:hypothetical protein PG989_004519 [Apiospora arundinis]
MTHEHPEALVRTTAYIGYTTLDMGPQQPSIRTFWLMAVADEDIMPLTGQGDPIAARFFTFDEAMQTVSPNYYYILRDAVAIMRFLLR